MRAEICSSLRFFVKSIINMNHTFLNDVYLDWTIGHPELSHQSSEPKGLIVVLYGFVSNCCREMFLLSKKLCQVDIESILVEWGRGGGGG